MAEDTDPRALKLLGHTDLSQRKIVAHRSFNDWLDKWNATENLSDLLGLLHSGLDTNLDSYIEGFRYWHDDRIICYLAIANGWADYHLLQEESGERHEQFFGYDIHGYPISKTSGEIRQIVARKAFDMLCTSFFKLGYPKEGSADQINRFEYDRLLLNERLFKAVQNFFRVSREGYVVEDDRMPNLPRSSSWLSPLSSVKHNLEIAQTFLLRIIDEIWKDEYYYNSEQFSTSTKEKLDQICISLRPWTIRVLDCLNQLHRIRKYLLQFDGPCLITLEIIALQTMRTERHPFYKKIPVESLDEAIMLGSEAASMLNDYKSAIQAKKRLDQIREAREEAENAKIKLEKLTGGSV